MTFQRHPSLSETWMNISKDSLDDPNVLGQYRVESLPGHNIIHDHTDGISFLKRNSHGTPLLVPPKYRGTPVDIIKEFDAPYGLAMTRHGLLVVSEFCGHRISLWDLNKSKRVGSIGCAGKGLGQFQYPAGVVITPRDTILVVDCYNDRIQEFTDDGAFLSCVGKLGGGPLQFDKPRGITFHSTGLVYVADRYNHRVQVLNPDFSFSHCIGNFGHKMGEFNTPYDIAFDNNGLLYVTDCGNGRVQKFTPEGRFLSSFGREGKKPAELSGPTGITFEDNVLFVTEYMNSRISMFTIDGQFFDVKLQKKLKDPYGIVYSPSGHLICSDFSNDRLVVLEKKN